MGQYGYKEIGMINIAIVEDDYKMAQDLERYVEQYAKEHKLEIFCTHYDNPINFLEKYKNVDIVFMDIQFGEGKMDGIQAAHKLRAIDNFTIIVFVTSYNQFAIRGYEVSAFDFIVKPVAYLNFSMRMNRIIQHLEKEDQSTITIHKSGEKKVVLMRDVSYIEILNQKILFHTHQGVIEGTGTIHKLEELLSEKGFARCNNCYLVNLRYVTRWKGDSVFIKETELKISRSKKQAFISALNQYWG